MRNTITVRPPEKLQRDLDKVVKAARTSRSDVIREAIECYIAIKRFQQLRKKILPFAEAEGLVRCQREEWPVTSRVKETWHPREE